MLICVFVYISRIIISAFGFYFKLNIFFRIISILNSISLIAKKFDTETVNKIKAAPGVIEAACHPQSEFVNQSKWA